MSVVGNCGGIIPPEMKREGYRELISQLREIRPIDFYKDMKGFLSKGEARGVHPFNNVLEEYVELRNDYVNSLYIPNENSAWNVDLMCHLYFQSNKYEDVINIRLVDQIMIKEFYPEFFLKLDNFFNALKPEQVCEFHLEKIKYNDNYPLKFVDYFYIKMDSKLQDFFENKLNEFENNKSSKVLLNYVRDCFPNEFPEVSEKNEYFYFLKNKLSELRENKPKSGLKM